VKTKARQEIIKGGGGRYAICPNVNRITSYFNSLWEIILMITIAQLIALNRITDENLYKRVFYLFKVMFRLNLIQYVRSDQLTDVSNKRLSCENDFVLSSVNELFLP
jgi:hypothetical protein